MSEHRPYEEMDEQFDAVPMPDAEASWQKMKQLLDKKESDRKPFFVLLRSCLGWVMVAAGLTFAWLVIQPEKWWQKTELSRLPVAVKENTSQQKTNDKRREELNTSTKIHTADAKTNVYGSIPPVESISVYQQPTPEMPGKSTSATASERKKSSKKLQNHHRNLELERSTFMVTGINQSKAVDVDLKINRSGPFAEGNNSLTQPLQLAAIDTAGTNILRMPVNPSENKNTRQQKKKISFAAGLGLQQQIPIAGQTTVPYSHYGRDGSLLDYIPSVFVQIQKENPWFIQGEFRYGAAQSIKEFPYNRKTFFDTASLRLTTTTLRLKKTYYHQLSLSFNYYLHPNFSVGMGGMYSRFNGAVTEKELNTYDTQNQTLTTTKQIISIKQFTDSFLYKTQWHVLAEANYHWRRFSFGFRFTKDIQPYIKYTRPDGMVETEKNASLQFMIRYKLLQPKSN